MSYLVELILKRLILLKAMRKIVLISTIFFPSWLKIFVYRNVLRWEIGEKVKIGLSYIDADHVMLGNNVSIGNFNIIRRLNFFQVGDNSYIKNFNQFFFSGKKSDTPAWAGKLAIGKKVHFMSHHFIDTGGSVSIGDNSTIAGRDIHFWSHGFVPEADGLKRIRTNIVIGQNVYIGARATLLGCKIPDESIVGAGSVVNKSFIAENSRILIAGNPAIIKKRYSADIKEIKLIS